MSHDHIDAIVTFAVTRVSSSLCYRHRGDMGHPTEITAEDADRIGQVLLDENCRSVAFWHREIPEKHVYKWRAFPGVPAVGIYKACRSLDYQCRRWQPFCGVRPVSICKVYKELDYRSCGADDWPGTEAFAILKAIEEAAMQEVMQAAGYDVAVWEIRRPAN